MAGNSTNIIDYIPCMGEQRVKVMFPLAEIAVMPSLFN